MSVSGAGGLLRYQIFLIYGILFIAIWLGVLNLTSSSSSSEQQQQQQPSIFVSYAPIWAIVALGIYALVSLIIGVLNFEDFPDAATEIEEQIKEARTEMIKRGVIIPNEEKKQSDEK